MIPGVEIDDFHVNAHFSQIGLDNQRKHPGPGSTYLKIEQLSLETVGIARCSQHLFRKLGIIGNLTNPLIVSKDVWRQWGVSRHPFPSKGRIHYPFIVNGCCHSFSDALIGVWMLLTVEPQHKNTDSFPLQYIHSRIEI